MDIERKRIRNWLSDYKSMKKELSKVRRKLSDSSLNELDINDLKKKEEYLSTYINEIDEKFKLLKAEYGSISVKIIMDVYINKLGIFNVAAKYKMSKRKLENLLEKYLDFLK